ncbi:MAG: T9SS type A sorting domain-containing protein [Bacteroidales bacterium]|nr:T9SS type A sorting domain-containing protein [Bacteroidales bacterium]
MPNQNHKAYLRNLLVYLIICISFIAYSNRLPTEDETKINAQFSERSKTLEVEMNKFGQGIYLVELTIGNKKTTSKIIKK